MSDEFQPGGDPAAGKEARDILGNAQNPRHEAYARGDKETVSYVTELLKKSNPGELDLSPISPELEAKMSKALEEQNQLPPEVKKTVDQVEQSLRAEWQVNYDANLKAAAEVAKELFGDAQAIEEFSARTGLDRNPELQTRAVKLLLDLAKNARR